MRIFIATTFLLMIVCLFTSCYTRKTIINNYESIYNSEIGLVIPCSFYNAQEILLYKNSILSIRINEFLVDDKTIDGIPFAYDFDYFDMSEQLIPGNVTFTYLLGDFERKEMYWNLVLVSELRNDDVSFIKYSVPKNFNSIKIVYQIRFPNGLLSEQNSIVYCRSR